MIRLFFISLFFYINSYASLSVGAIDDDYSMPDKYNIVILGFYDTYHYTGNGTKDDPLVEYSTVDDVTYAHYWTYNGTDGYGTYFYTIDTYYAKFVLDSETDGFKYYDIPTGTPYNECDDGFAPTSINGAYTCNRDSSAYYKKDENGDYVEVPLSELENGGTYFKFDENGFQEYSIVDSSDSDSDSSNYDGYSDGGVAPDGTTSHDDSASAFDVDGENEQNEPYMCPDGARELYLGSGNYTCDRTCEQVGEDTLSDGSCGTVICSYDYPNGNYDQLTLSTCSNPTINDFNRYDEFLQISSINYSSERCPDLCYGHIKVSEIDDSTNTDETDNSDSTDSSNSDSSDSESESDNNSTEIIGSPNDENSTVDNNSTLDVNGSFSDVPEASDGSGGNSLTDNLKDLGDKVVENTDALKLNTEALGDINGSLNGLSDSIFGLGGVLGDLNVSIGGLGDSILGLGDVLGDLNSTIGGFGDYFDDFNSSLFDINSSLGGILDFLEDLKTINIDFIGDGLNRIISRFSSLNLFESSSCGSISAISFSLSNGRTYTILDQNLINQLPVGIIRTLFISFFTISAVVLFFKGS